MTDPQYMRSGVAFAVGKLVEELGELQSALGKTIRWGFYSVNPELEESDQETNYLWIEREIKDVEEAIANYREQVREARDGPEDLLDGGQFKFED